MLRARRLLFCLLLALAGGLPVDALAAQVLLLLSDCPGTRDDLFAWARQTGNEVTHTEPRERGATLVATLHHVDMALAHFPRIIGLRDGELAFDLPAAQVTPERLRALYAQHLDELTGPAPADVDVPAMASPPPVMHCR